MHKTTGRWQLGLLLSFTTALFWGLLPIALKLVLAVLDAVTVIWFRFLVAALCVGLYLLSQYGIPKNPRLTLKSTALFVIVVLGLTGNYLFYLKGLETIPPSSAQIVIQLAPMLLMLGSLLVFGERLSRFQTVGLILFLTGLGLFFNHRLDDLWRDSNHYTLGIVFTVIAALTWAAYALAQKQLLKYFKSTEIMLIIYLFGCLLFLPASQVTALAELDQLTWGLLLFCSLNTIVAYGCFAEALDHLEASRVSAVLAITPLLTIVFMQLVERLYPGHIVPEPLNLISIIGATVMVLGSMITALSKNHSTLINNSE